MTLNVGSSLFQYVHRNCYQFIFQWNYSIYFIHTFYLLWLLFSLDCDGKKICSSTKSILESLNLLNFSDAELDYFIEVGIKVYSKRSMFPMIYIRFESFRTEVSLISDINHFSAYKYFKKLTNRYVVRIKIMNSLNKIS